MRSSTAGQIEARGGLPAADPPRTGPVDSPSALMSSTGTTTCTSIVFALAAAPARPRAARRGTGPPRRSGGRSPTGRCAAPAVRAFVEALERERQVRAPLGARHGVHLVDDDGVDAPQRLASGGGEDEEQRLGRGDEDVGRHLVEPRRSSAGVSPDRMPTAMSGTGRSRRCDACRMPVSGARRLRSTSTASALSGLTYRTRQRCRGCSGTGWRPAGRATTGTPTASCRCRSARRRACRDRRRSRPRRPPERRSGPRTHPRTRPASPGRSGRARSSVHPRPRPGGAPAQPCLRNHDRT